MPKPRTTGCKQEHDGGRCRDCNRIRVSRARALAGKRPDPPTRLALTAAQRQANAASQARRDRATRCLRALRSRDASLAVVAAAAATLLPP
jgi:hypothetical protein